MKGKEVNMWQRANQGGGGAEYSQIAVGTPAIGATHTITVPSGVTKGVLVAYGYSTSNMNINSVTGATLGTKLGRSQASTAGGYETRDYYPCTITGSTIIVTFAAAGTLEHNIDLIC